MRRCPVLLLLFCLWPMLALGQTQSATTKENESSKQDVKLCLDDSSAKEVLRLGRSLGYTDFDILEAYSINRCGTLSELRQEAQQKAQLTSTAQPNSTEQALKTGYVKCEGSATEVSVWRAIGDLTVVASPKCGEKLDILEQDADLWLKVRTLNGTVGYILSLDVRGRPKSPPKSPTITSVSPPSQTAPTKKQHPIRDTFLATLSAFAKGASEPDMVFNGHEWVPNPSKYGSSAAQHGGTYAGAGSGHWIDEVSSGGGIVTLEDGSLWEISDLDRVDTALWLPTTSITVLESHSPVAEYKYDLINTDDGEKALAKYLGTE